MTAKRKPRRARSAPPPPAPTANQLFEAMLAFSRLKMRYRLEVLRDAPPHMRFIVRVLPEMMVGDVEFMGVKGLPPLCEMGPLPNAAVTSIHRFTSEQDARQWRETAIIREVITAGMRARP